MSGGGAVVAGVLAVGGQWPLVFHLRGRSARSFRKASAARRSTPAIDIDVALGKLLVAPTVCHATHQTILVFGSTCLRCTDKGIDSIQTITESTTNSPWSTCQTSALNPDGVIRVRMQESKRRALNVLHLPLNEAVSELVSARISTRYLWSDAPATGVPPLQSPRLHRSAGSGLLEQSLADVPRKPRRSRRLSYRRRRRRNHPDVRSR